MESVVLGPAPSDALVDRAVVAWLVLATAVLGVVFLVTLGLNRYVVDIPDLKRTFDFALETNVPTWWNTVLLAGVAASFLLAARLHPGDALPTRRSLLVAALAVAYLSLDEAAQLHELAGEPTSSLLDDQTPNSAWSTRFIGVGPFSAATTMSSRRIPHRPGR